MRRLLLCGLVLVLAGGAQAQTDTVLWSQALYAPKNETHMQVDADDNVYLGYVTATHFTLRKLSPNGLAMWASSIPYIANAGTQAQLEIGPDGDPYLATASGSAQLRRFNRLNGQVRWTVKLPMTKFHFAVYEKISVYGDRPSGPTFAAQCLTYTLAGKLTQSTGFEAGYRAGKVWDGLIQYNTQGGPATKRALVKVRYAMNQGGFWQVVIDNETYLTNLWEFGALGVNQNSAASQIVVGGRTENDVLSHVYQYGEGLVSSKMFPSGTQQIMPDKVSLGERVPYTIALHSSDKLFIVNADGSEYPGPYEDTVSNGRTSALVDAAGQLHTLWTANGWGARLDQSTHLDTSTQTRSPQIALASNGDIFVSYIRQNGSPAVVVSRIKVAISARASLESLRNNQTKDINLFYTSRGFDDGTDDNHFSITVNPQHGTANLQPNGVVTYTPDADFSGTDTFTYRVSKVGASAEALVTMRVHPQLMSVSATDATSNTTTEVTANFDSASAFGEVLSAGFSPQGKIAYQGPGSWDINVPSGQSSTSRTYTCLAVTSSTVVNTTVSGAYGASATTSFTINP